MLGEGTELSCGAYKVACIVGEAVAVEAGTWSIGID